MFIQRVAPLGARGDSQEIQVVGLIQVTNSLWGLFLRRFSGGGW
jgi:hypothetical protein